MQKRISWKLPNGTIKRARGSELLWNEIDFFSVNNIVGFYDHELNAISIKESPQQELLIDMLPDKEDIYLIIHLHNDFKSKMLIKDFRTNPINSKPDE